MVLQDRELLSMHKSVVFLLCLFAFSFQVWNQANFTFLEKKNKAVAISAFCFLPWGSEMLRGLEEGIKEGKGGILGSTGSRSGKPASPCDTYWPL